MLFSKIKGNISKEKHWLERIAVKRIYAAKKPICSTVLKIEVSIPEEKHWLETIASWSDNVGFCRDNVGLQRLCM